jgi:hypothetical protein
MKEGFAPTGKDRDQRTFLALGATAIFAYL